MTRHWDYDVRLVGWVREHVGREFIWGLTDCGTLMMESLIVQFGDVIRDQLPWYDSLEGAKRALAMTGGTKAWLLEHGATEVPVAYAQAGDIIIGPGDELTDSTFVVIAIGKMLRTHPGERVEVVEISRALPSSICLRVPDVWQRS